MDERKFIKELNIILWYDLEFNEDFEVRELLKKYIKNNNLVCNNIKND